MVTKLTQVRTFIRKSQKGRLVRVHPYKRRNKKLGPSVRKKRIGTFILLFDKQGNIRGSKVIPFKKSK